MPTSDPTTGPTSAPTDKVGVLDCVSKHCGRHSSLPYFLALEETKQASLDETKCVADTSAVGAGELILFVMLSNKYADNQADQPPAKCYAFAASFFASNSQPFGSPFACTSKQDEFYIWSFLNSDIYTDLSYLKAPDAKAQSEADKSSAFKNEPSDRLVEAI